MVVKALSPYVSKLNFLCRLSAISNLPSLTIDAVIANSSFGVGVEEGLGVEVARGWDVGDKVLVVVAAIVVLLVSAEARVESVSFEPTEVDRVSGVRVGMIPSASPAPLNRDAIRLNAQQMIKRPITIDAILPSKDCRRAISRFQ